MAVLELSRALGRPLQSWSVDGSLDGGARTYRVTFLEKAADPSRKTAETILNNAADTDRVRIRETIVEGLTEQEVELVEGTIDEYAAGEDDEHTPSFSLAGRSALKAQLVTFYPAEPVTYRGRIVASDGTLGQSFWTFQEAALDICTRAGVSRVRFHCPDWILGTDLAWATDMSADAALTWLLENGGMRATEKWRTDLFEIREPDGWALYFVRRGNLGTVITLDYPVKKETRDPVRRRPESHWWPSVQVLGMSYQVQVPDIPPGPDPVPGKAWSLGYTIDFPAEDVVDSSGRLLSRKEPHRIHYLADGRVEHEEWTLTKYIYFADAPFSVKGTRIETGEVTYTYDLQTKDPTSKRTVLVVTDPTIPNPLAGDTVKDRLERWEYGVVQGVQLNRRVVRLHTVIEQRMDENLPASQRSLQTVLEERTDVIESASRLFKRYVRRRIDPKTGQTEIEGEASELSPLPLEGGDTSLPPGVRTEQRELKSGDDAAFKKLRFPAIGEQAWLDQVLADVLDEKGSWRVECPFSIVPDLRVQEGFSILWLNAPARWGVKEFLVTHFRPSHDEHGVVTMPITGLAWI